MDNTKLDANQYAQLSDALAECYDVDNGASSRAGSHFYLIHLLNLLGFRVNGWQAAEKKAKELLDG
jgi:hypothetical protein